MADRPDSGPDSGPAESGPALSAAALLRRFQLWADSGGSFLKFSGISPSVFEEFYTLLDGRITYFGAASGVLFVKMPTLRHETVLTMTMDITKRQVPECSILRVRSTRYESVRNLAAKEGDDGILPMHQLFAGATFPSFVFEVAYTQSPADVREAMKWWFCNTDEVRYVLIANITDTNLGEIIFELWRRDITRPKKASIRLQSSHQQPDKDLNPDL
jgi:hypothetical protein